MIKQTALKYLGYPDNQVDHQTDLLLNQCLQELEKIQPKFMYQIYSLNHHPLSIKELNINLEYPELTDLFDSCDKVCVIACTLGIEVDKLLRYYSHVDMAKMTVFDALASSYLEAKCDEFENKQNFGKKTFRFCPGYGSVPLELNQKLAQVLACDKHIGLTVQKNHLLIPQKSMIGLIGIGDNKITRHCFSCINLDNCIYRKKGQRCYKTE